MTDQEDYDEMANNILPVFGGELLLPGLSKQLPFSRSDCVYSISYIRGKRGEVDVVEYIPCPQPKDILVTQSKYILSTGLTRCYDGDGEQIDCQGTGQDAEYMVGVAWPGDRFELMGEGLVQDRATGLIWTRNSCLSEFPLSWQESLEFVEQMNRETRYGRSDWRMPNRRELRSLVDHGRKNPVLSRNHPFQHVFLGWFWTSTTAAIAPRYAWYVHFAGGRMFYGRKDDYCWVWPVCGSSPVLACTGASRCYNEQGLPVNCGKSRQDGAIGMGVPWPTPRFVETQFGVRDGLTGLTWDTKALLGRKMGSWSEALATVSTHADETGLPWRMPTINELESLVDASTHTPALPATHPFGEVQEAYWSSTTSSFETDWAYVLYLNKGAVGVGYKKNSDFALWPVLSMTAHDHPMGGIERKSDSRG